MTLTRTFANRCPRIAITVFFLMAFFVAAAARAAEADGTQTGGTVGLRVDCMHFFNSGKGASQDCVNVSGLRYEASYVLSPKVRATLRLDPFGTPWSAKADTPLRADVPSVRDTDFVLVDDYSLIWSPRPNLDVAAESYGGAAQVPSVSGLSLAHAFVESGWKQTAVDVTYHLTALTPMEVKFAVGNGEGENGKNLDAQQYFGFSVVAQAIKGVVLNLGISLDGNSSGSRETDATEARLTRDCGYVAPAVRASLGHSTQRIAAGVKIDGTLPGAEGLMLALGWQRSVWRDLDKNAASAPSAADYANCKQLDPDTYFAEAAAGDSANAVQHTVSEASARYRLFERYFAAADFTTRFLDTGGVQAFTTCGDYENQACVSPNADASNRMAQTALTFGGGMELEPGLVVTLEYGKSSFDKKYSQLFYLDSDGKTSTTEEIFNARLAYNWR